MSITLQRELLRIGQNLGEINRSFHVEGRLNLPAGSPPLGQIQFFRARVRGLRATAETGIIRVEGAVELELNYAAPAAEEFERPFHQAVWSIDNGGALELVQEMAAPGVPAGASIEVQAAIGGVVLDPLDGASLRCQVTLDAVAGGTAWQERNVTTEALVVPAGHADVVKEPLNLESLVGQAQSSVSVDTVLTLPEIKPDLLRIIARNAGIADLKVEIIRGRAALEGRLTAGVVYICRGEDGVQGLDNAEWGVEGKTPIGFEAFIDLPGLGPDVSILPRAELAGLQLESIGPREVRLMASVNLQATALRLQQVNVVTDLIPGADELVDLQRDQLDCTHVLGVAEKEIVFEAAVELPPGKPDLHRILQWQAQPVELTAQAADGKCLIDGWLNLALLYQAEEPGDPRPALAGVEWAKGKGTGIPLAEVMELPEANPNLDILFSWGVYRCSAEQAGPRSIRLSVMLAARAAACERRMLPMLREAALVPVAPVSGRPAMLFYIVQPGDTLWTVARRYDTTVEALSRMNKIAEGAIAAGQKLRIPNSPIAV